MTIDCATCTVVADPFRASVRLQTRLFVGPDHEPALLDDRLRHVLGQAGRFRPARHSPLRQFGAVCNAGWVPHDASVYRLYRIPDGWASLHLAGINLPGHSRIAVQPCWFLGGGTARLRLLALNGMAGCFNLRVPPWSCLALFGLRGRQLPDHGRVLRPNGSVGRNILQMDFARIAAATAQGCDIDDALGRYESVLAQAMDGIYEDLPARRQHQIEIATRAARIGLQHEGMITVAGIADALDLSVAHLRRIFNGLAPIGLSTWLDTIRFWRALDLIDRRPTDDLTTIAYAAGFADSSHMTRQFHRHVGMPPSIFRRELGRRIVILGGIMAVVDMPVESVCTLPEPLDLACLAVGGCQR